MHLTEHKVYIYYNQPCLLSYKNEKGLFYIAVWISEEDIYLISKISKEDLIKFEASKMNKIKHLFINSKCSFLYNIDTNIIIKKFSQDIPQNYLPLI